MPNAVRQAISWYFAFIFFGFFGAIYFWKWQWDDDNDDRYDLRKLLIFFGFFGAISLYLAFYMSFHLPFMVERELWEKITMTLLMTPVVTAVIFTYPIILITLSSIINLIKRLWKRPS